MKSTEPRAYVHCVHFLVKTISLVGTRNSAWTQSAVTKTTVFHSVIAVCALRNAICIGHREILGCTTEYCRAVTDVDRRTYRPIQRIACKSALRHKRTMATSWSPWIGRQRPTSVTIHHSLRPLLPGLVLRRNISDEYRLPTLIAVSPVTLRSHVFDVLSVPYWCDLEPPLTSDVSATIIWPWSVLKYRNQVLIWPCAWIWGSGVWPWH